jgi:hypothetical protein
MDATEENRQSPVTHMAALDEIGQVGAPTNDASLPTGPIENGEDEMGEEEGEQAEPASSTSSTALGQDGSQYAEDETWQALLSEEDEEVEAKGDDDYCPKEEEEEEEEEPDDLDFEAEKEEQERGEEEGEEDIPFDHGLADDDEDAGPKRKKGKKNNTLLPLGKEEGPISCYSPSTLAAEIFSVTIKKKMGGPTCDPDFAAIKKKRKSGTAKKKQPAKKRKNAWDSPPQAPTSGTRKKSAQKLLPDLMHRSVTAIPMSSVPVIFSRVLKTLPPSDYDIYEIQNLIVTYALDEATYGGENAEERIYGDVMRLVTSDKKFIHRHVPVGHSFSHVQTDAAMLKKYEAFLNSPNERSKRRDFLSERGSARHGWTEDELERYQLATGESLPFSLTFPGS